MDTHFNAIISLLFLAGIFYIAFWLYTDYLLDSFRQKLFSLRDELFDECRKGHLNFDDEAYVLVRSTINGVIRFAHNLSFLPIFLMLFSGKRSRHELDKEYKTHFQASLEKLTPEQAKIIENYRFRMNSMMVEYITLNSPILLLTVFLPLVAFLTAHGWAKRITTWLKVPLDRLDSLALAAGKG